MSRKKTGTTRKTKETVDVQGKNPEPVKNTRAIRVKREVYTSPETYLISSGEKPTKIPYMAKWAEQRGYTIATNEQWKEIFAEF